MLRKLALSLAIAGALGTSTAHALGLGEIRITSALNEPLQAEIQLLQMRSVDPQQVQPKMGNVDDFALAGIEKLRFLSDVKFQVKAGPSGQGVIVLTSTAPVKEPFLNFLLEVNWPSGRLVREYTVLLDPPIYDPAPPPVTIQPVRSAATGSSNTVSTRPVAQQKPVDNIRSRMTDGQVYVDVNDTLWDIAKLHKPDGSVTEAQMMLALQRKNPGAFRNNNVNQLKAGVVMDIPSLSEVQALDRQQANEEFWRQTQRWKQGVTAKGAELSPSADKQGGVSGKKSDEVATRSAQGQLKIVSPEKAAETGGVSAQAADTDMSQADAELLEKNQQLETELASALETVDQIQRENEELSGRVDALAQQMESLQRLLELKDQHMAELQAELESAKSQPVIAPVEPAESAPAAEKSLIEQFGLYIGAAGGALIAFLLALLLMRRGKKDDASEVDVTPAVAAAATAAVVDQAADEDMVEAVVEEASADDLEPVIDDADLDDLDLDLDMDMEQVETAGENDINEDEFDLGFDDDFDSAPAAEAVEETEDGEEIDDALDSILGENTDAFDINDLRVPEVEGLGDLPMDEPEEEPEADNIDDLLASFDEPGVEEVEAEAPVEPEVEASVETTTDEDDLEFDIDSLADDSASAVMQELAEEVEIEDEFDLDFDLDETPEVDVNQASVADVDVEAVDELAFDLDDVVEPDVSEAHVADADELDFNLSDVDGADALDDGDLSLGSVAADELASEDVVDELDLDADAALDQLLTEASEDESDLEELDLDLDADLQAMLDGEDEVVLDETEMAAPVSQASASQDLDAELDSELEMLLNDAGSDELSLDMTDDTEEYGLDNLNLLEDADEVETKLDLARAYIDMEDLDGAKDILGEILKEGNEAQQSEANGLLNSLG